MLKFGIILLVQKQRIHDNRQSRQDNVWLLSKEAFCHGTKHSHHQPTDRADIGWDEAHRLQWGYDLEILPACHGAVPEILWADRAGSIQPGTNPKFRICSGIPVPCTCTSMEWIWHWSPNGLATPALRPLWFAHADTEAKRKAIEKAMGSGTGESEKSSNYIIDDEDLLKQLYGL